MKGRYAWKLIKGIWLGVLIIIGGLGGMVLGVCGLMAAERVFGGRR